MRELYEADFHKPGIYGSGRVWANAWDVFPRILSRVGRGRGAAVDFVVSFGWGGFFSFISFVFFIRTHTACCKYEAASCLIYLSTSTGVRTGYHYLISLSVCVTFIVFTDRGSCTRPISTNPGSMEAGEDGLTRGTRFVAVCLDLVAVAGLLWISWCVFWWAGIFFLFFR